jgi:hypothetical protein
VNYHGKIAIITGILNVVFLLMLKSIHRTLLMKQCCQSVVGNGFIRLKNISCELIYVFNMKWCFVFCFCSRRLQEKDKADKFNNLGKVKWELAVSLLVVFIFVYFALWKGIKSSGKVRFFSIYSIWIWIYSLGCMDYGYCTLCRFIYSLNSWCYSRWCITWY